jgi:hypothetical protein
MEINYRGRPKGFARKLPFSTGRKSREIAMNPLSQMRAVTSTDGMTADLYSEIECGSNLSFDENGKRTTRP